MTTKEAKELINELEYYTQEEYARYCEEAEEAKILSRNALESYISKLEFSLGLVENEYSISTKTYDILIAFGNLIRDTFEDWQSAFYNDEPITNTPWRNELEEYISYLEENSK